MGTAARTSEDPLVEVGRRLAAMGTWETTVPDYLAAGWQDHLREREDGDGGPPHRRDDDEDERVCAAWREKICEWCYEVVDHFDFDRETAELALHFLDRYLAARRVDREAFQLAAVTSLYLAAKLGRPACLRPSALAALSRGRCTASDITTMEEDLLARLGWRVHPPTSAAFLGDFFRLASPDVPPAAFHEAKELARFLTELAVCDYWFVPKKASSVALAAVLMALELHAPRANVTFLRRVRDTGLDIDVAPDSETIECYERLRDLYTAGGWARGDVGAPTAAVSPTGAMDGPYAHDPSDDNLFGVDCVY